MGIDDHPCDGLWYPLAALASLSPPRRDHAVAVLIDGGYTGVFGQQHGPSVDRADGALRLDAGGGDVDIRSRHWTALLALEPDIIGLALPALEDAERFFQLCDSAADHEIGVCLLVPANRDRAARCSEVIRGMQGLLTVSTDGYDEDLLDALAPRAEIAASVGGDEFATSFRRGATAFEGLPALLGPELGHALLDLCGEHLGAALDLERRLIRFFEGPFERALRGAGCERSAALAALGGWLPDTSLRDLFIEDPGPWRDLRLELEASCPGLNGLAGRQKKREPSSAAPRSPGGVARKPPNSSL